MMQDNTQRTIHDCIGSLALLQNGPIRNAANFRAYSLRAIGFTISTSITNGYQCLLLSYSC